LANVELGKGGKTAQGTAGFPNDGSSLTPNGTAKRLAPQGPPLVLSGKNLTTGPRRRARSSDFWEERKCASRRGYNDSTERAGRAPPRQFTAAIGNAPSQHPPCDRVWCSRNVQRHHSPLSKPSYRRLDVLKGSTAEDVCGESEILVSQIHHEDDGGIQTALFRHGVRVLDVFSTPSEQMYPCLSVFSIGETKMDDHGRVAATLGPAWFEIHPSERWRSYTPAAAVLLPDAGLSRTAIRLPPEEPFRCNGRWGSSLRVRKERPDLSDGVAVPFVVGITIASVGSVPSELSLQLTSLLAWVRSGELRGYNVVARQGSKRPKYRVNPEDLEAFIRQRAAAPKSEGRPARPHRSIPKVSWPHLNEAKRGCAPSPSAAAPR